MDNKRTIEILETEVVITPKNMVAVGAAIAALEQQEKKGWIPVTERLPETEDKVLCCTITKKGTKNIVLGYYVSDKEYWACGMNSNVIAWQPLPEPYQEDKA